MTKAEEFEILLTRWEDRLRQSIRQNKRLTGDHLFQRLKSGETTYVLNNTRMELDGFINGAQISMNNVWNYIYSDECPEIDGTDMILQIILKLTRENYEWERALNQIEYDFRDGNIPIEELRTRIDEVEVG